MQRSKIFPSFVGLLTLLQKFYLDLEDLTSFDIVFYYEDSEHIPLSIEATVSPHTRNVSITLNFFSEQTPCLEDSTSTKGDQNDGGSDDWDFWNGRNGHSSSNGSWRHYMQRSDESQSSYLRNVGQGGRMRFGSRDHLTDSEGEPEYGMNIAIPSAINPPSLSLNCDKSLTIANPLA